MSTHHVKVMQPPPVPAPRGAFWAASAALGLGRAVWYGLTAIGQARGSRALLDLARRKESENPGLAQQLRISGEAALVRQRAYRYVQSDPRFASELFAAADRHERLAEPADLTSALPPG
jgi:hypothetical protein